jgi:hypothetical protein
MATLFPQLFVSDLSHGLHFGNEREVSILTTVRPSFQAEPYPIRSYHMQLHSFDCQWAPVAQQSCWPRFYKVCAGRDLKFWMWVADIPKVWCCFYSCSWLKVWRSLVYTSTWPCLFQGLVRRCSDLVTMIVRLIASGQLSASQVSYFETVIQWCGSTFHRYWKPPLGSGISQPTMFD